MFSRVLPILALALSIAPTVLGAPVPVASLDSRATNPSTTFVEQNYSAFQISDGTAGGALAQANAVFVDPFAGRDLSTVSATELKAVQNMRLAAEDAETSDFNPQIDAATGAAKTALQNGKIKNKVLKLVGEIQGLKIQQAQGKDTSSSITTETKKLNNNIALDTKASGQPSKGVA